MVRLLWQRPRAPRNAWMMDPDQDQGGVELPARRIVICTSPRTASNTLGYLMLSAGLGMPWEYFGEGRPEILAARWGLPAVTPQSQAFVNTLMKQRSVNGVFGVKLQWSGFRQYLTHDVWSACFGDALVIYLEREDREAQAISLAVAMATGRWFQNPDAEPVQVASSDLQGYLASAKRQIDEEYLGWESYFKQSGIKPLRLSMEQFTAAPVAFVEKIAGLTGAEIDAVSLRQHAGLVGKYMTDATLKAQLSALIR